MKINVAKLKRVIIENTGPGKKFSRRGLSLAATEGKNPDLVRDLINRGQDRKPSIESVAGIAAALELDLSEFIAGVSASVEPDVIKVIGTVEAGAWREQAQWPEEQWYDLEVHPSPVSDVDRFGLRVEGFSMDKVFPPGTELDCLRIKFGEGPLRPEPGDIVVVQRRNGDLYETTCKRLELAPDGIYQLRAESTRPEFQEPIPLGRPDRDHHVDTGIEIIGIVNQAYQRHFRRRPAA